MFMWSMQDDCKAQSVKHGLSSEEKKIYTYLIYLSILAVIYDLYDNIENCSSTTKIIYVNHNNPYYI